MIFLSSLTRESLKLLSGDNWINPNCFDDMIASDLLDIHINNLPKNHLWLGSKNPNFQSSQKNLYALHETIS